MGFLYIHAPAKAQDSIIFNENFEESQIPSEWTQEKVIGDQSGSIIEWEINSGGHSGNPPAPAQGANNAFFQYESYNGETTKLITPKLDISDVTKPELRFFHAQDIWTASGSDWWDHLKVYYKNGNEASWVLLNEYTEPVEQWVEHSILLPDSSRSSEYYIAFEGITNYGHGVCIDSVTIVETGEISKYIDEIEYKQASTNFVPTGSQHNRILQVNFTVKGNEGDITLDSIAFESLNTDDEYIKSDGVKLYATSDTLFDRNNLLGSPTNFTNGTATFKELNYSLPRGKSSIWLTYDLKEDASHEMEGNYLDAKIKANGIKVNDRYYYPLTEKSPVGKRVIKESIYLDNFVSDQGWTLNGEFEIAEPQGLGEDASGKPDPSEAYRETRVLGTDLTDNGTYRRDLTAYADSAVSPTIDCEYFQDVKLNFYRWLNVDIFDKAYIHTSSNGGENWQELWESPGFVTDGEWKLKSYDINDIAYRNPEVKIRYSLGPTNNINDYTGWNIDNIIVTGDYISTDAGVSNWLKPLDGCGHTDSEDVQVVVNNYGGDPINEPIPIYYSLDGGETKVRDTIYQNIPVGDSITHTFSTKADLTDPGWYENIKTATTLSSDEVDSNNEYNHELFITPTYQPPYTENFENGYGYYLEHGDSSTWEHGMPQNTSIDTAYSGSYAWVTGKSSNYKNNDSSYLETPCFDFSNMRHPIFEFQLWNIMEENKDGLALYYSVDDGENWNIVPKNGDYDWNWYNSENIEALGTAGWDTSTTTWMEAKQLLPSETAGQSSIKFRFVCASDSFYRYEGAAIDDIKIYEAPPDVGVSSMPWPESQCELSDAVYPEVYITNFGIDTLFAGDSIPIALKQQDNAFIKDTLVLSSFLEPGDSVQYTFKDSLDMSYSGDYPMKIYTRLEKDPFFYSESNNDTLSRTISVLGMPRYNIGDVVGTPPPVDTTLDAGAGYSTYNWNTGATTQTINVSSAGWYDVTVTNDNGCSASDSVRVVDSEINTGITQIITSVGDACTHPNPLEYTVEISNMGLKDLNAGDTIPLAYQINEQEPVADTMFLSGSQSLTTTAPDSTIQFTFTEKLDLSEPGFYELKFYTNFSDDYDRRDDTATTTVNTWGYPDTELRYDTLLTTQADTLTLDAGSGFDTYQWQDGSSNPTFDIQHNRSQWYKVVVTDIHGCGEDADSTHIIASDIGIDSLVHPLNSCEFTSSEQAVVRIRNHSADTLLPGSTIPVGLHVNGTAYNDNVSLADSIMPGSYSDVTLDPVFDISATGTHQFRVYTSRTPDANHSNDTLQKQIHTWGYPDVELTRDTIFTTQADTVELSAGSGFDSYTWQDGSGGETYEVSKNYSALYKVTVSDAHGCGTDSDSTQIFTYDLGIAEMTSPKSDCELSNAEPIRIKVQNFSNDTLKSGDKIPMGYQVEGGPLNRDTLTLADMLLPGNSISHTFSQKADLSSLETTYRFDIFVDHPHDANMSNDTLLDAVKTFGFPDFSLNHDTVVTTRADTVKLYGDIEENAYLWQDGTNTDTFYVDRNTTETYHLTVTDLNGCSWRDTAEVITYDLAVDSIINPVDACEHGSAESLTIQVRNQGQDTLLTGRTVPLGYRFDGGAASYEDHVLTQDLYPDSTFSHTFSGSFDMSGLGTYDFTAFSAMNKDARRTNDTMRWSADHYGYPQVDLGPDTIKTNRADTITLEAPAGYDSYLWQDGSGGATYSITSKESKLYHVTVTNTNGCAASDSVMIMATDLEMVSLVSPESGCGLTHQEEVTVKVYNNSGKSIEAGEKLPFLMTTPAGIFHDDTVALSEPFAAGDTMTFTYSRTLDLSVPQSYDLEVYVDYGPDFTNSNDTLNRVIHSQAQPNPNLGVDTSLTAAEYVLDAGSYDQYLWHDGSTNRTFTIDARSTTTDSLYHVEVTNQAGCKGSDTVKVGLTVHDLAISEFFPTADVCLPQEMSTVSMTLKNAGNRNIPADSLLTVSYRFNGSGEMSKTIELSSDLQPRETLIHEFAEKIDLTSTGSYDFQLSANYNGDVQSSNNDTSLTVEVHPTPDLDLGPDTLNTTLPHTLEPGNYAGYEWDNGSTSATYEVTEPGLYGLTVYNQYDCPDYDEIYIQDATAIGDASPAGYKAKVYPNPASDHIIIELEADRQEAFTIRLISNQGFTVQNREVTLENGEIRLNTRQMARGVYYLTIGTSGYRETKKVILK